MTTFPDFYRRPRVGSYAVAIASVGVATIIEVALARAVGGWYLFAAFSPAVAVAAWFGGFGPGALATLLATVAADYFLFEPFTLLTVAGQREAVALSTFVVCWLVVSMLAERVYRRLQREGEWRREAVRMAAEADRLEQLTAALASARTSLATTEACVQEALHSLGADAGALLVVAEDVQFATVIKAVGYAAPCLQPGTRVSLTDRTPLADAVRLHVPVVLESPERWAADYPAAGSTERAGFGATAALALVTRGVTVAALRIDFQAPRPFSEDDRRFLAAIGPRAAQALDRAWQYEASQRARAEAENQRARADVELSERQRVEAALRASETRYRVLAARTSRLHGLSGALSEAATLRAVGKAIARHGKIVVGAEMADVRVLDHEKRRLVRLHADGETGGSAGGDDDSELASGLSATSAIETRRPVFIASQAEWQERFPRSAALAADGGFVSSASLPLLVEGRPIGVLEFHFTLPVNFDEEYRSLLVSVAQHASQALDRARLYESAERARAEAETANRVKDDFLSTVSHELRTPLNAILGWAAMLQKGDILDEAGAARALAAIHDNANRQARLIEDLLDLSRMASGRVALEWKEVEVGPLLAGAIESMLAVASTAGIQLALGDVSAARVRADPARLEQVVLNIVGNALKFTPAGGRVEVRGERVGKGEIEIVVADTGLGIEPGFLPHVFDRFRQGDATVGRSRSGLGLGLSIAKQLVEAHGGTIRAESDGPGRGATFRVRLPLLVAPPNQAPAAGGGASV